MSGPGCFSNVRLRRILVENGEDPISEDIRAGTGQIRFRKEETSLLLSQEEYDVRRESRVLGTRTVCGTAVVTL